MRTVKPGEQRATPRQQSRPTAVSAVGDADRVAWYLVEGGDQAADVVSSLTFPPDAADGRTWTRLPMAPFQAGKRVVFPLRVIEHATFTERYVDAVITDPDGELVRTVDGNAQRYIVRCPREAFAKSEGEDKPTVKPAFVVFVGSIDVIGRFTTYSLTSKRTLVPAEWSRYVRLAITHPSGQTIVDDVAAMDMRQQQAKATFIDKFDLAHENSITDILRYIRIKLATMRNEGCAIADQGPFTHEGKRYYAARSGVLTESGEITPGYWVRLPDGGRHAVYDVTPPGELDPERVADGIEYFRRAYVEMPTTPQIPAAMLGSLFTGPVVAIEPDLFIALMLHGLSNSGKSYYTKRFDAIQTRTVRNIAEMKPLINMGDTDGTRKGPKYRVVEYGGYSLTADDLIKAEDTVAKELEAKTFVSNIIRSFEEGAAAIGTVDRAANRVTHRESGELHSNIKFTSERPVPGVSTNNRLIVLPRLEKPWGENGNPFDVTVSRELSTRDAIEAQHQAWSAYVAWLMTNLGQLSVWYDQAHNITGTWDVPARSSSRYAAVIAGHLMFKAWCVTRGVDITAEVDAAITALESNARRQASDNVPYADRFRRRLYAAIADQRVSFMGRPVHDPVSKAVIRQYTHPFPEVVTTDETGISTVNRETPKSVTDPSLFGMARKGKSVLTATGSIPHGYVLPPAAKRRGRPAKNGSYDNSRWYVIIDDTQMERLARELTMYSRTLDGFEFTADAIKEMVRLDQTIGETGFTKRVAVTPDGVETGPRQRNTLISVEWLYGLLAGKDDH